MIRIKFLMILIVIFIMLTRCGQKESTELVECTEFALPGNYCPSAIEDVVASNQVYVQGYDSNIYDYFVFEKTEEGYSSAKKLDFPFRNGFQRRY